MKKDDLIILLIALLLLAGMLMTIFFGGEKSLHGVGSFFHEIPGTGFQARSSVSRLPTLYS